MTMGRRKFMKVARWYGRRDIRVESVPVPSPAPGTVRVKVTWAGICGSDVHEFVAGPILISADEPHPLTGKKAPLVIGHEFGGYVSDVGDGVEGIHVGDRVAVSPLLSCGECVYCKMGRPNLCLRSAYMGFNADGGMAGYVVVPAENLYVLSDEIEDYVMAFGEPVAVAVHAIRKSGFRKGMNVAIVGGGTIGLLIAQLVKLQGASRVFLFEKSENKRKLIKSLDMPIDYILNPLENSDMERLKSLTGGLGADVAFDAGGSRVTPDILSLDSMYQNSLNVALKAVRRGGPVVMVAVHYIQRSIFDFLDVLRFEKAIIGSWIFNPDDFKQAIDILKSRNLNLRQMITGMIHIDEIVEKGLLELELNGDKHIKILVTPHHEYIE